MQRYRDLNFSIFLMLAALISLPILSACGPQPKTGTNVSFHADSANAQELDTSSSVDAPYTRVQTDDFTGHSSVRAPYVKLDSQEDGRATLRAPFVKIDHDEDGLKIKVGRHHHHHHLFDSHYDYPEE